ncbi:MAG: hypothetical protein J0I17_11810 ['Candidatus Kapabacteria' thiocyanatum]|uniref:DoxX family protein n=1 Tax=Candidatus Kapaibacterium thiocyanatum TaxID=1895771 RepID=A0A1M3L359_9BACT|nr:hypothetical protein ['Candidatus Kapabacteria' thiocyanatum]OJX59685.1 MAG: hypothetical protein BGO89_05565 ['Candidatus Kapabacteria' thiocyanatum]
MPRVVSLPMRFLNDRHVEWLIRWAFAIVYVWFGILKFTDLSPAHDLVMQTLSMVPVDNVSALLGGWEIIIGLCFLAPRFTKITLSMFFVHIAGTFLPVFFLPSVTWLKPPYGLSFVGQYILKNLVFIAAGTALAQRSLRS